MGRKKTAAAIKAVEMGLGFGAIYDGYCIQNVDWRGKVFGNKIIEIGPSDASPTEDFIALIDPRDKSVFTLSAHPSTKCIAILSNIEKDKITKPSSRYFI